MWSRSVEVFNPCGILKLADSAQPNTKLSFGTEDEKCNFLVCYRRVKPLNRFQIWMYKVCFGIIATNL